MTSKRDEDDIGKEIMSIENREDYRLKEKSKIIEEKRKMSERNRED